MVYNSMFLNLKYAQQQARLHTFNAQFVDKSPDISDHIPYIFYKWLSLLRTFKLL